MKRVSTIPKKGYFSISKVQTRVDSQDKINF